MEIQEEEITLKELIQIIQGYWNYLVSKWRVIAVAVLIGSAIGLSASFIIKPQYKGALTFVIDEDNKAGGLASLASSFGLVGAMGEQSLFSSSNIIEFLKTRIMVESALLRPIPEAPYQNKTYAEVYIKENKLDKNWEDHPVLKDIRFNVRDNRSMFGREKDSILGAIYTHIIEKNLSVSQPNKEVSFIEVNVVTTNEIFSKNFANELIDIVSEYYIKSKTQKAQSSVDVLQRQTDSVSNALYSSMSGAASSLDQVFGLNPAMNIQKVSSAKGQTQVQMNAIILQELVKNLELAKMNLLNNTPAITVVARPIYPLEIDSIGKAKGIVFGGFLAGFSIVIFLIGRKYWANLMQENA